eukprot:51301-Chlamydomonas_euryale.AAC.3
MLSWAIPPGSCWDAELSSSVEQLCVHNQCDGEQQERDDAVQDDLVLHHVPRHARQRLARLGDALVRRLQRGARPLNRLALAVQVDQDAGARVLWGESEGTPAEPGKTVGKGGGGRMLGSCLAGKTEEDTGIARENSWEKRGGMMPGSCPFGVVRSRVKNLCGQKAGIPHRDWLEGSRCLAFLPRRSSSPHPQPSA